MREESGDSSAALVRAKWREGAGLAPPRALSVTEILERGSSSSAVATDRDIVQRLKIATNRYGRSQVDGDPEVSIARENRRAR